MLCTVKKIFMQEALSLLTFNLLNLDLDRTCFLFIDSVCWSLGLITVRHGSHFLADFRAHTQMIDR